MTPPQPEISGRRYPQRNTTRKPRLALRLLLVMGGILVGLACAEIDMQLLDEPKPTMSGWRGVYAASFELNQLGYRGQKIEYSDDDFVVLLVGDSQVEAKACALEEMPERRLEAHLNESGGWGRRVRVFSVGASGYGQDQELLAMREYFAKYRADLVVLWETPINDLWNNVFPTSFPADGTPKPTFWLEGGALRGPSELIGQPIRETPKLKLMQIFTKKSRWSRDGEWERRLPPPYTPLMDAGGEEIRDDWQQEHDTEFNPMRLENLANEKSHLTIFLTPRSPRTTYGLDLMRALILEMQRDSSARAARFVAFVTDNPLSEEHMHSEGLHRLGGKLYRTSRAQYSENLAYFNRGFDFLSIPVTLEDWKANAADPHLNQQATDQVMKDLAGRLTSLLSVRR
ncbi:MAG: hypothetical protein QOF61_2930 [Acidobacteriota bacterium]|nr:hypothetical protein [Acidobacteriota bacterium]